VFSVRYELNSLVLFKRIQVSNLDRRTLVRELHMAFKIPYVYDYITKYAENSQKSSKSHLNPNVRAI
jgi:hypothetical protein